MDETLQLVIIMTRDGRVTVNGPLQNKMLCYGMLEMARNLIKDYSPPLVQPVKLDVNLPKKGNGQ